MDGKIKPEDLKSGVPLFFVLLAGGPNKDFVLGRVYEFIVLDMSDKLLEDLDEKFRSNDDLRKGRASDKFLKKNCKLIK